MFFCAFLVVLIDLERIHLLNKFFREVFLAILIVFEPQNSRESVNGSSRIADGF